MDSFDNEFDNNIVLNDFNRFCNNVDFDNLCNSILKNKSKSVLNFDYKDYFDKEVKCNWFDNLYYNSKDFYNYLYDIYYGGRCSGKSEAIARSIIINCLFMKQSVILCARNIQKSTEDSVKPLLKRIIAEYVDKGYITKDYFIIKKNEIIDKNKNKIIFKGLQDFKSTDIKGLDNIKICWLEEASKTSRKMLSILLKTIVRFNCKFIASFNRDLINDPIYDYFVNHTRANTLAKYLTYKENPFMPIEAERMRIEDLREMNEDQYNHDWLGEPFTEDQILLFNSKILNSIKEFKADNGLMLNKNIMGVDVAKGEVDKSVIFIRNHNEIIFGRSYLGLNAEQLCNEIIDLQKEYKVDEINCDIGNIGYAVDQILLNYNFEFYKKYFNPVLFGNVPRNDVFFNKRAEMYYIVNTINTYNII